jgi:diguanylate cyclase (GGDEF)-like protein
MHRDLLALPAEAQPDVARVLDAWRLQYVSPREALAAVEPVAQRHTPWPSLDAAARFQHAMAAMRLLPAEQSADLLAQAAAAATASGDPLAAWRVAVAHGMHRVLLGQVAKAVEALQACIEHPPALAEADDRWLALNALSIALAMAADMDRALPAYYRALQAARTSGLPMLLATTACNLGGYQTDLHNPEEARPLLEEALAVALDHGSDRLVGLLAPGLVECYGALGLHDEALALVQRFLLQARFAASTDPAAVATTAALAWLNVGRLDEAEQALARAWAAHGDDQAEVAGARFSSSLSAFTASVQAQWWVRSGRMAEADAFCERVLAEGAWQGALDNPSDRIRFFAAAALAAEAQGDFRRALQRERERWQVFERMTARGAKARLQTLHVRHELARLQHERDAARRAAQLARDEGDRLRDQALRDALTGLHNRRHLEQVVAPRLSGAPHADGLGTALALLDLDRFKAVNDTHGHAAGDQVLRALAGVLRAGIRKGDVACRVGGEEFVVVLPGVTPEQARARCQALLARFAGTAVDVGSTALTGLSFSCGVAHTARHGSELTGLLKAADEALYRAKTQGRAQVVDAA